jgi:hypothetical protein
MSSECIERSLGVDTLTTLFMKNKSVFTVSIPAFATASHAQPARKQNIFKLMFDDSG